MPLSTLLDDPSNVTQLRGLAFLSLSEQGEVLSLTSTSDSGGGATQGWTSGGTIACRIDPMGGGESSVADGISDRSTHVVTLASGESVSLNSRFRVIGGDTYEITAIRDRTRGYVQRLEVMKA